VITETHEELHAPVLALRVSLALFASAGSHNIADLCAVCVLTALLAIYEEVVLLIVSCLIVSCLSIEYVLNIVANGVKTKSLHVNVDVLLLLSSSLVALGFAQLVSNALRVCTDLLTEIREELVALMTAALVTLALPGTAEFRNSADLYAV